VDENRRKNKIFNYFDWKTFAMRLMKIGRIENSGRLKKALARLLLNFTVFWLNEAHFGN
jgi:hypothetical protein